MEKYSVNVPIGGSVRQVVNCDGYEKATAFLNTADTTLTLSVRATHEGKESAVLDAGAEGVDSTIQADVTGLKSMVLIVTNSDGVNAKTADILLEMG